eukprot:8381706-Karenia_brevis.AAC.1
MKPWQPGSNKMVTGKLTGLLTWVHRPVSCQKLRLDPSSRRTQSYGSCTLGWWPLYNNCQAGRWHKSDT